MAEEEYGVRYTISFKGRGYHLVVDQRIHTMVKFYAKQKNISLTQATYELLNRALQQVYQEEGWV